jgi:hypothetical protein
MECESSKRDQPRLELREQSGTTTDHLALQRERVRQSAHAFVRPGNKKEVRTQSHEATPGTKWRPSVISLLSGLTIRPQSKSSSPASSATDSTYSAW